MDWTDLHTIPHVIIACNEEPNQVTGWAVSTNLTVRAHGDERRIVLPEGWRMLLKDGISYESVEACRYESWEPDAAISLAWWTTADAATLKVARIEPIGPVHGITGRARDGIIRTITHYIEGETRP